MTAIWVAISHCLTAVWVAIGHCLTAVWVAISQCLTAIWVAISQCLTAVWVAISHSMTAIWVAISHCMTAVWVAVSHCLLYPTHVSYNCHNVQFYHIHLFIDEISSLWGIVNVSMQTSQLSIHTVKSPMVLTVMPSSQFYCLALRSSGMCFLFSPTVPLLHFFFVKSSKIQRRKKTVNI
jgi:hypothetical protein